MLRSFLLFVGALFIGLQAQARDLAVETIVSLDNGEFNTPFFTPRYNGKWTRPSAAADLTSRIARAVGDNPKVYQYMPSGRTPSRPGELVRVLPTTRDCEASLPCPCEPGDNCWKNIRPNYHPVGSSSLFLTASAIDRQHTGPRIEFHVTDLFEEDPSSAERPEDSDRCVTAEGMQRALQAVFRSETKGKRITESAVALVRVSIDAPPPGGSWGNLYNLEALDDTCFGARKIGNWNRKADRFDMAMAIVAIGVNTDGELRRAIDNLQEQLNDTEWRSRWTWLQDSPHSTVVEDGLPVERIDPWLLHSPTVSRVPCQQVRAEARLMSGDLEVPVRAVGRCDGAVEVRFEPRGLSRAFARQAKMDPNHTLLEMSGTVVLTGEKQALIAELEATGRTHNGGDRPLPLWSSTTALVEQMAPWKHEVQIRSLVVEGLDHRPWWLAFAGGVGFGIALAISVAYLIKTVHANRAMRAAWGRSMAPEADPLMQKPMALVIAEAQERVHRSWPIRVAVGAAVGGVGSLVVFVAILQFYLVILG